MGEGTHGVKASPDDLEREVESIREGMTPVLDELDHRRHELAAVPNRLKARVPGILKAVMTAAALFTVMRMVRRRRSRSKKSRTSRVPSF